jgi:hypothetical protein
VTRSFLLPPAAILLSAALLITACGGEGTAGSQDTPTALPAGVSVGIVAPKDGETIGVDVVLQVEATGIEIAPASLGQSGAAHYHVFVDKEPVAEGEVVPSGNDIYHLTDPTLELTLRPEEHTITVVLGDNDHRRLPGVAPATVTFTTEREGN